jgi:hypothetical protein
MKLSSLRTALAACLSVLLCHSTSSIAQQKPEQQNQNARLAKPTNWDDLTLRLFKDSQDDMVFKIVTSWIPGEANKGIFRYKLTATPKLNHGYRSALAQYQIMFKLMQSCAIVVVLFNPDGGVLQRIYPTFGPLINDQMDAMSANENLQMNALEYEGFLGTPGTLASGARTTSTPGLICAAGQSDHSKRKRSLFVYEQCGDPCRGEDA